MTTARDIMTPGAECIGENETIQAAARKMRDLDVGALPICGEDGRLKGMLTDRDIVLTCVAEAHDVTSMVAGEYAQGEVVTVGADDDIQVAMDTMQKHQVRRLPVIDGHDLVGIIAQADIAVSLDAQSTGETVADISQ